MTAVVGIDVGGTKIAAGLVEPATGSVAARRDIPTDAARGGEAVLSDVVALARDLGGDAAAVGVGVPEMVDAAGRVRSAANWDWRGVDLPAAFAGLPPARVVSDVHAAAAAEARFGAGRDAGSFLYASVGTGISTSFVVDGRPWPGADGRAIILGAPLVEQVASGPALARAAGRATAEEALADPSCAAAVAAAADALGLELARAVHLLDPGLVVLGGGLGLATPFRSLVADALRRAVDDRYANVPDVVPAGLGADAGVIGAALAAV